MKSITSRLNCLRQCKADAMGARPTRFDRDVRAIPSLTLPDVYEVVRAVQDRLEETDGDVEPSARQAAAQEARQSTWQHLRRRSAEGVGSTKQRVLRNTRRWSVEQLLGMLDACIGAMQSRLVKFSNKLEHRFRGLLAARQPPLQRGDILVCNFAGPSFLGMFKHCKLVVGEAEPSSGGRWKVPTVEAVSGGVRALHLSYPQDLRGIGERGDDIQHEWDTQALSAGESAVFVVRFRDQDAALLDLVVRIGREWGGLGESPALRYLMSTHILRPGVCLGSGHGAVDAAAALRYMDALRHGGDSQVEGVICSELVFAAWSAALGFRAEAEGRDISTVLEHDLPIVDARGCWPRSAWGLGSKVERSWERVGIIRCPLTRP